jgi:glutathione reductase (NADPH)
VPFDWAGLKKKRDEYIKRLNGIYGNNLDRSKVEHIPGVAKFVGILNSIIVPMRL